MPSNDAPNLGNTSPSSQRSRWVFTWNNYDNDTCDDVLQGFFDLWCKRLGYGREIGTNGTPHLQGFFILKKPVRFGVLKTRLNINAHIEIMK